MMKTRYKLTPQMREYDKIGQVWLPYLMYFHRPNFSSKVVNTDSRGFRVSYKDKRKISNFENKAQDPTCLLVGGSGAFGVGATSDTKTIPSILNQHSKDLWLNFGGRAFNSTQELLLFLFYQDLLKNTKRVVLYSGINNLVLHYLSKNKSKELGSFFFSNQYQRAMSNSLHSLKRRALNAIIGTGKDELSDTGKRLTSKDDVISLLKRDIRIWKSLCDMYDIELTYVLQPFSGWIKKDLSKEEEALFGELDKMPINHFKVIKNKLNNSEYMWFRKSLSEICKNANIKFFDMNEAISKQKLDGKWIYVDRHILMMMVMKSYQKF